MSFNAIRENKIIAKISEFKVFNIAGTYSQCSAYIYPSPNAIEMAFGWWADDGHSYSLSIGKIS